MESKIPCSTTFETLPLTFDRVMEGRPIAAKHSRLFNLPVEILSVITYYLRADDDALASLALVNSDCRQLARSCQFRDILIDYGPRSSRILGVLIREATERFRAKDRLTRQPSLGACVRYIKTSLSHYWKEVDLMQPEREEDDESPETTKWEESVDYLTTRMNNVYFPSSLLVITSLPHLEVLYWNQATTLDRYILDSLGTSTIRHLKLRGSIDSEGIAVQLETGASWPLLTLDIDMSWDTHFRLRRDPADSSTFWNSLFQACSSTLRILKFSHRTIIPSNCKDVPISFTAKFPHLQSLHIGDKTVISRPSLTRLLRSPRLSNLVVNFSDKITRKCLDRIGHLRSLQTLVWTGFDIPDKSSLRPLENNSQLTAFGIESSQSLALLTRVVPILTLCSNLKVLSLTWDGTIIPDSELISLASLTSLEQLHISSGSQFDWRHDWFVDHDSVRNMLSPLCKLKKIFFSRDSYRVNNLLQGPDSGVYYLSRLPDIDDYGQFMRLQLLDANQTQNSVQDVFEVLHCQRMTREAEKYAFTFPELEYLRIGQLSFAFGRCLNGQRTTVLLDPARNEHFSALESVFGMSWE